MKQKSGLRIESAEEVNAILKEVTEFTIRGLWKLCPLETPNTP